MDPDFQVSLILNTATLKGCFVVGLLMKLPTERLSFGNVHCKAALAKSTQDVLSLVLSVNSFYVHFNLQIPF